MSKGYYKNNKYILPPMKFVKPIMYNEIIKDYKNIVLNNKIITKGDNNMMNEENEKELVSKQLGALIIENNIEVDKEDNNYIYMYLSTDKNGKLFNGINCAVGKTIASNDGVCVGSLNDVKEVQKGSIIQWMDCSKNYARNFLPPINPSILKEKTFKIFKVKVNKNNIERFEKDYNDNVTFYTTELEIIEEVQIENKISYKIQNIKQNEKHNGFFDFLFEVTNEITYRSITVDFVSDKIDLTQEEIQIKIKERLDVMQSIYDEYEVSHGELEL